MLRTGCGLPVPAARKRSSATPPSKNPPTGKTTHRERGHRKSRALRRPPQRPQSPAHGGPGITAQQALERVHEREHEQRLEGTRSGRARSATPTRAQTARTPPYLARSRGTRRTRAPAQKERVHGERDSERSAGPSRTAADPCARAAARAQPPRNQEEETRAERPGHAEHSRQELDHADGHLVVRLELQRPVDPYFRHARRAAALD